MFCILTCVDYFNDFLATNDTLTIVSEMSIGGIDGHLASFLYNDANLTKTEKKA